MLFYFLASGKSYGEDEEPIQLSEFGEQLAEDLALLDENLIDLGTTTDTISVSVEAISPLSALITDALVRYGYNSKTVLPYMFNLVGVQD